MKIFSWFISIDFFKVKESKAVEAPSLPFWLHILDVTCSYSYFWCWLIGWRKSFRTSGRVCLGLYLNASKPIVFYRNGAKFIKNYNLQWIKFEIMQNKYSSLWMPFYSSKSYYTFQNSVFDILCKCKSNQLF